MTARSANCPQCASPRQGELRFCANCGFDYREVALENAIPAAAATAPVAGATVASAADSSDKKNRRIGCITIGVIALIIFAIIGSLGGDPNDDETADATSSPTPTTAAESGSPSPTSTPVASVRSSSTAPPSTSTPTATASPLPSLEAEPAFASIELNGTGNAVPRFEIPADAVAVADITHTGASNFAVWTIDESGEQTDLLVNAIGNYAGTVLFDEADGSHTVAFDVEADGTWAITIKPVTEAFRWDGSESLAGNGDDVAILVPPSSGFKSTTLTHNGDGNFAIWTYGDTTDLLVNEIGVFSGEVLLTSGTFLFEITANGPWSISPPQ